MQPSDPINTDLSTLLMLAELISFWNSIICLESKNLKIKLIVSSLVFFNSNYKFIELWSLALWSIFYSKLSESKLINLISNHRAFICENSIERILFSGQVWIATGKARVVYADVFCVLLVRNEFLFILPASLV